MECTEIAKSEICMAACGVGVLKSSSIQVGCSPYMRHNLICRLEGPLGGPRLPMNAQAQFHLPRLYPAAAAALISLYVK